MRALTASCIVLFLSPVVAQSVSVAVTTATPIVANAFSSVSGLSSNEMLPANTAIDSYLANPLVGGAEARSQWVAFATAGEARAEWRQMVQVVENAPSFAGASGELLMHLTATSGVPVTIELSRVLGATPGAMAPACSIDVGDDGSFEVQATGSSVVTLVGIVLGPQPLAIRLRSSVAQIGNGMVDLELKVHVRPQNSLSSGVAVAGCTGSTLFAYPTFESQGLRFVALAADPVLLVVGLSVQPVLLPSPSPTACLLLPAPDLLVLLVGQSEFTLPLPPVVRPVTFWAQGVELSPLGLPTTNGYASFAF